MTDDAFTKAAAAVMLDPESAARAVGLDIAWARAVDADVIAALLRHERPGVGVEQFIGALAGIMVNIIADHMPPETWSEHVAAISENLLTAVQIRHALHGKSPTEARN